MSATDLSTGRPANLPGTPHAGGWAGPGVAGPNIDLSVGGTPTSSASAAGVTQSGGGAGYGYRL
ncbi:MAG TPA: hypothetical protein VHW44_06505 [Pseudonocardiaceae bacterium]|jgi:hypothetical protein|nr:hypothetical protein [Pseudonocardiaceae bacterium]